MTMTPDDVQKQVVSPDEQAGAARNGDRRADTLSSLARDEPSSGEQPTAQRFALLLFHHDLLDRNYVDELRTIIEEHGWQPGERDAREVDIWLESSGGDAHAAYKLMLLLREYAATIRIVVPDYAKSAATLMVLGADEVYMAPAAELGPLDAQIRLEGDAESISALDVANAIDSLIIAALSLATAGGGQIVRTTQLSRQQTLDAMLGFSARFMRPLVSKLNPSLIHRSNNHLRVAYEYAVRLQDLRREGVSLQSDELQDLVRGYPTHGFVISAREASELGLSVLPSQEYPYWDIVAREHREFRQSNARVLKMVDPMSLQVPDGCEGDAQ
ncbi:MAG: SDH family Clp fold serine proteinase [Egibacteraceae bacterium]